MFNKKDPPKRTNLPDIESSKDLHLVTLEQFKALEEKLAQQATINSCLIKILEDINNHKREETILKKLDDLKNFITGKK